MQHFLNLLKEALFTGLLITDRQERKRGQEGGEEGRQRRGGQGKGRKGRRKEKTKARLAVDNFKMTVEVFGR